MHFLHCHYYLFVTLRLWKALACIYSTTFQSSAKISQTVGENIVYPSPSTLMRKYGLSFSASCVPSPTNFTYNSAPGHPSRITFLPSLSNGSTSSNVIFFTLSLNTCYSDSIRKRVGRQSK